jgi:hypothetical protein
MVGDDCRYRWEVEQFVVIPWFVEAANIREACTSEIEYLD